MNGWLAGLSNYAFTPVSFAKEDCENGREPFISMIRLLYETHVKIDKMIGVIFIPSTIRFLRHDPINHAIVTSTGKTKVLEMRIVIGQKNPAAGENASFEFLSSSLF